MMFFRSAMRPATSSSLMLFSPLVPVNSKTGALLVAVNDFELFLCLLYPLVTLRSSGVGEGTRAGDSIIFCGELVGMVPGSPLGGSAITTRGIICA